MKNSDKEKIKLIADMLKGLAMIMIIFGIVRPIAIDSALSWANLSTGESLIFLANSIMYIILAIVLVLEAFKELEKLDKDD